MSNNTPKNVYKLKPDIYTYGRVGEYAPRIMRVHAKSKDGSKRGRPSYRRIRGGIVPGDIVPETTCALALLAALQAADKVGEA